MNREAQACNWSGYFSERNSSQVEYEGVFLWQNVTFASWVEAHVSPVEKRVWHSDVLGAESLSPGFCVRESQRIDSTGKLGAQTGLFRLGCVVWGVWTGVRRLECPDDWGTQTGCQTNKSQSPTVSEFILFEFRHQRCGKKVAPLKARTTHHTWHFHTVWSIECSHYSQLFLKAMHSEI